MQCIVGAMMLIFLAVGIALFWSAIKGLWQRWRQIPRLVSAEGVILTLHKERRLIGPAANLRGRSKRRIANYPVTQFQTQTGETVSFQSELGDLGKQSRYSPGQRVKVLYDPERQTPPMIDSWWGIWFGLMMQAIAGVVFVGGAVLIWVAFGDKILGEY